MVEPGLPAHQRHVNSIFITGFSMDDVLIMIFELPYYLKTARLEITYLLQKELLRI